jgi:riboflavin synthase
MFTGIVEEVGAVVRIRRSGEDAVLQIRAQTVLGDTQLGDSIAINGVCLTVTELRSDGFSVDLSVETLHRTNLGKLRTGDPLNLERSLAMGGRMGGHFVQGHIDGTGTVQRVTPEGRGKRIRIAAPPEILRYAVPKGYIAVDGMSLTVVEPDETSFAVAFIPHTLAHSVAAHYRSGVTVNLEADILGKYVERFLTRQEPESPGVTWDLLEQNGFTL